MWVTLESPSITEMAVALGLGLDRHRCRARPPRLERDRRAHAGHGAQRHGRARAAHRAQHQPREASARYRRRWHRDSVGGNGRPASRSWSRSPTIRRAGVRGIGAERATGWGQCIPEHIAEANEHVLVMPMIESVRGGQNIGEMVKVDGVEMFLLGPADYSSSAGFAGQWQGPGVGEQLAADQKRDRGGRQILRRDCHERGQSHRAPRAGLPHDRPRLGLRLSCFAACTRCWRRPAAIEK